MNRLGNEASLYLRQHADNPVHWQPWDDHALAEARESGKPILLSIGYSACHWCHVMAHESFEDQTTAEMMNRLYVNVKVDREERPDLDRVYQLSHQLLSGRGGGWPLTVFLDPVEHVPFFAGTYFPLEKRYGMPAFREVLTAVHDWYRKNPQEVRQQTGKLQAAITSIQSPDSGDLPDQAAAGEILRKGAQQIQSRHDVVNGGYGGAPKFPQAPMLEAVAALGELETGGSLHRGLEFTLQRMSVSGLRDHLDGGFFRYCVDEDWTIPHFEKMLYDNAMLLPLYAEGARRWDDRGLAETAEGIVHWLLASMRQPTGGYAASIDADAAGEEGSFHVWQKTQVEQSLPGESAAPFVRAYGLDRPPNFENRAWHLVRHRDPAALATEFKRSEASMEALLHSAREQLHEIRSQRVHPTLDNKQLTSWNALLAAGLVRAAVALDRNDWLEHAEGILHFIRDELWTGDGLLAVFNAGDASFEAYLDDYAWLLDALLLYLKARWDKDWLVFALKVADAMLDRFEDRDNGGFHFSDRTVEVPMGRSMIFQDDATPAGNAVAICALNRLGRLLGDARYMAAADRCLGRAIKSLGQSPLGHCSLLRALQEATSPPPHLVIAGASADRQSELKRWAERRYQVDCYQLGPPDPDLPGVLKDYQPDGPIMAWLCRGTHCLPPVKTQDELEQLLNPPNLT